MRVRGGCVGSTLSSSSLLSLFTREVWRGQGMGGGRGGSRRNWKRGAGGSRRED